MIAWLLLGLALGQDRCTYQAAAWDVGARRSIPLPPVDKPRTALTDEERGPLGCTPCREDQQTLTLSNGLEFTACVKIAEAVRDLLDRALAQGAVIATISGYRPIRSRGPLDDQGRRTVLSNHAYGAALDINREHNGLYADCPRFGPGCRLLHGGPWRPGEDPLSLTPDHLVVRALAQLGLVWGGALAGDQKDFMHFSPEGS